MPDDTNPYQPPEATLSHETLIEGTGRIDLGEALTNAWNATWANFPLWLGIGFVGWVGSVIAVLTIIGILAVLPVLLWGFAYAALRMYDGKGEFGDLFAGFQRYGDAVLGPLVLVVLVFVLTITFSFLPLLLIGTTDQLTATFVQWGVQLVFTAFLLRFYFALFLIVDRGLGPFEALAESWNRTEGQWLMLVLMYLVGTMISVIGVLLLGVGVIPATAISGFMWTAAYRQIFGRVERSVA